MNKRLALKLAEFRYRKKPDIPLREVEQFNLDSDWLLIRYDFAYVDPCHGRTVQITVESTVRDRDELDERSVPVARATVARMLERKCGIKVALDNIVTLPLPRWVPGRYV